MSLDKISKIFYFLANTSPSEISIHSLSKKLQVNNALLENVLCFLAKIGVVHFLSKSGDFIVREKNQEYIFEIGGGAKTRKQIKNNSNAFVVQDVMMTERKKNIPLWVFGFLR